MSIRDELIDFIKEKVLLKSDSKKFKCCSGGVTDKYFDIKYLTLNPKYLDKIAKHVVDEVIVKNNHVPDTIGGLLTGSEPIANAIAFECYVRGIGENITVSSVRRERKKYGSEREIEGLNTKDKKVLIVDDVCSTNHSINYVIKKYKEYGVEPIALFVIIDSDKINEENKNLLPRFSIFANHNF